MTVTRLKVERWCEPKFDDAIGAIKQNVLAAQEWLSVALEGAVDRYQFENNHGIRERLFVAPNSVQEFGQLQLQNLLRPVSVDSAVVSDAGLALYEFKAGLLGQTSQKGGSKRKRREAGALGTFWFSNDRIWPRGRPLATNIPLLLYFIFVIEEIIGKPFPRSRPWSEVEAKPRPPSGPAFELLRAAYAQTSLKLHVMPPNGESVYSAVHVARSSAFRKDLRMLKGRYASAGFVRAHSGFADFVAMRPSECALIFARTRARRLAPAKKARNAKGRKRPD